MVSFCSSKNFEIVCGRHDSRFESIFGNRAMVFISKDITREQKSQMKIIECCINFSWCVSEIDAWHATKFIASLGKMNTYSLCSCVYLVVYLFDVHPNLSKMLHWHPIIENDFENCQLPNQTFIDAAVHTELELNTKFNRRICISRK